MRAEESGVLHDCRQRLSLGDFGRHVPVRAEDDVSHLVVEDRRRRVLLSDDDAHRERHLVAFPDFEPILGNVDEDVALAEFARQPAPAFEVELELPDPRVDRHVHLRHDAAAIDSVVRESVPALEALDRLLQIARRVGGGLAVCRQRPAVVADAASRFASVATCGLRLARLDAQIRGDAGQPPFAAARWYSASDLAQRDVLRRCPASAPPATRRRGSFRECLLEMADADRISPA